VPSPLWRNRDFLLLLSGQTISGMGNLISHVAMPLLVLAITGSPAQAGIVGALEWIPFLLFGLIIGALIDRWNRKLVMVLCDAARAVAYAVVPVAQFSGHLGMPVLYGVALVEGIGFAFFNLAEIAALTQVVPRDQLPSATAQNQAAFALANVAGPPVGGILFGVGRAIPFALDSVSYAVSVLSLLLIRVRFQDERDEQGERERDMLVDIREGIRWIWNRPMIRVMALLTGSVNLVFAAPQLIAIVYLERDLHANAAQIGTMLGFSAIGGVAGSLLGVRLRRWLSFQAVIVGVLLAVGVLWSLLVLASNIVTVAILGAGIFLAFPAYDITQYSYRIAMIPDVLQGRVNSVFRLVALAGQPVGMVLSGALLQAVGPRPTILLTGAGMLLLGAVAFLNPHLRHAPRDPPPPA
jgi:MFS family permease